MKNQLKILIIIASSILVFAITSIYFSDTIYYENNRPIPKKYYRDGGYAMSKKIKNNWVYGTVTGSAVLILLSTSFLLFSSKHKRIKANTLEEEIRTKRLKKKKFSKKMISFINSQEFWKHYGGEIQHLVEKHGKPWENYYNFSKSKKKDDIYCSKCSLLLSINDSFCPRCGAPVKSKDNI